MKIRISELETYEIRFPEVMEYTQLDQFVQRLQAIKRMMGRDPLNEHAVPDEPAAPRRKSKFPQLDREQAIALLKEYAAAQNGGKIEVLAKHDINQSSWHYLKNKLIAEHQIKEEEYMTHD